MEWFIVSWMFIVGACVGSFLNVVVYRVPAGKSLWYPGSQCPACGHAIRARHNVPVLGWLMLKGRCYDCGARIASRYPLVELLTAGMFLAVAVPEFGLNGSNFFNPLGQAWPLWLRGVVYAIHVILLCILLVAGRIAWDGQRVPLSMQAVALVLAGIALAVVPQLKPLLFATGMRFEPPAAAVAFRAAAGSLAGLLTRPAMPRGREGWRRTIEMSLCLALVAVILGWQAVTQITALSAVVYLLFHALGRRSRLIVSSPRLAYAGLATFLAILFFKPLLEWLTRQERNVELAFCGGLLALAYVCSWLARWAGLGQAAPLEQVGAANAGPPETSRRQRRREERRARKARK